MENIIIVAIVIGAFFLGYAMGFSPRILPNLNSIIAKLGFNQYSLKYAQENRAKEYSPRKFAPGTPYQVNELIDLYKTNTD